MPDPTIIVPYDPEWPYLFSDLGNQIRNTFGDIAVRINHVGSTSIPNIAAKPIIDIQVSVKNLNEIGQVEQKMNEIGFYSKREDTEKSLMYFRELQGNKGSQISIKRSETWSEFSAILFRDYMRCHPSECRIYEAKKFELSKIYRNEERNYTKGKSEVIWEIIQRANRWSLETGWYPRESDI